MCLVLKKKNKIKSIGSSTDWILDDSAQLNTRRGDFSVAVVQGRAYAFGGYSSENLDDWFVLDSLEIVKKKKK